MLGVLAVLILLSACGDLLDVGQDSPIKSFNARPTSVEPGEAVMLQWEVEDRSGVRLALYQTDEKTKETISLGDVTGLDERVVQVWSTTTYRLEASGAGGKASRTTRVSVGPDDGGGDDGGGDDGGGDDGGGDDGGGDDGGGDGGGDPCIAASGFSGSVLASAGGTFTSQSVSGDKILLVIAGQSNASGSGTDPDGNYTQGSTSGVYLLDGDDWVVASEPSHAGAKYSFASSLGGELRRQTGAEVYIVPVAIGGTRLQQWERGYSGSEDVDAFEKARDKAQYAACDLGIPVSALVWFQGESDTKWSSTRRRFVEKTNSVLNDLRSEMSNPDVIFVQLAKRIYQPDNPKSAPGHNLAYQELREKQRLMEAGARNLAVGESDPGGSSDAVGHYHMVVSHDLPVSDDKHLSKAGQQELGKRIANSFMRNLWSGGSGEEGPRLERVELSSDRRSIFVDTTVRINDSSTYDGYFTIFVDGEKRAYSSIGRDSSDHTRVRIGFASPLPSSGVEVRYMPPDDTPLHQRSTQVVHAVDGSLKLPLPAFGLPVEPFSPPDGEMFPGSVGAGRTF